MKVNSAYEMLGQSVGLLLFSPGKRPTGMWQPALPEPSLLKVLLDRTEDPVPHGLGHVRVLFQIPGFIDGNRTRQSVFEISGANIVFMRGLHFTRTYRRIDVFVDMAIPFLVDDDIIKKGSQHLP